MSEKKCKNLMGLYNIMTIQVPCVKSINFTILSLQAGCDTKSIFKQLIWIQSFPSSRLVAIARLDSPFYLTILPIAGGEEEKKKKKKKKKERFMFFSRVLVWKWNKQLRPRKSTPVHFSWYILSIKRLSTFTLKPSKSGDTFSGKIIKIKFLPRKKSVLL